MWVCNSEYTLSKRSSLYINIIPQIVSVHVIYIVGALGPGRVPKSVAGTLQGSLLNSRFQTD